MRCSHGDDNWRAWVWAVSRGWFEFKIYEPHRSIIETPLDYSFCYIVIDFDLEMVISIFVLADSSVGIIFINPNSWRSMHSSFLLFHSRGQLRASSFFLCTWSIFEFSSFDLLRGTLLAGNDLLFGCCCCCCRSLQVSHILFPESTWFYNMPSQGLPLKVELL